MQPNAPRPPDDDLRSVEIAREFIRDKKRRQRNRRITVLCLQLLLVIVILGGWELSARNAWMNPVFTSKPSDVWTALFAEIDGNMLPALGVTLYETLVGFAIASAVGFIVGCLMYEFNIFDRVIQPFLTAVNSMPRIALAPLFILWFGLGSTSRVVLVISLVIFIVINSTHAGLRQGDRDYLTLAQQLGAKGPRRFFMFVLPAAVPTLFSGLQLGLVYAFLGAVAGEMIGGSGGLGAELSTSLATFRTSAFMADLLVLVIVTVAFSALMKLIERRLLRWQVHELRGFGPSGS